MSDDIQRLEAGQLALSKDVRELTKGISELVSMQKVMQIEADYLKKSQIKIEQHIIYSTPILAKSKTWQDRMESVLTKVLVVIAVGALAGVSYNSFQPAKVEMKLSKREAPAVSIHRAQYAGNSDNCDPRLEACPRPTQTALREEA